MNSHPNEPKKRKKPIDQAVQCKYIKFQSPVAPAEDTEPVYELKLESKDAKYKVDQLSHDEHTVYIRRGDSVSHSPWVNAVVARPIQG